MDLETFTVTDIIEGNVPPNTVSLGGYKTNIYGGSEESTVLRKVETPYGIPMDTLIARNIEGLLFSDRYISMDHGALCSALSCPSA